MRRRRPRRRGPPGAAPPARRKDQHQQARQGDAQADTAEAPPRQLCGAAAGVVQHPVHGDHEQHRACEPGDPADHQPGEYVVRQRHQRQAGHDRDERQPPRRRGADQSGCCHTRERPRRAQTGLRRHQRQDGGVDESAYAHGRRQSRCATGDVHVWMGQEHDAIVGGAPRCPPGPLYSHLKGAASQRRWTARASRRAPPGSSRSASPRHAGIPCPPTGARGRLRRPPRPPCAADSSGGGSRDSRAEPVIRTRR